MKKSILLSIAICSLLFGICHAQWQPDVRLTNAPGDSFTPVNNAWSIATSGDVLHVVWYDFRDGNWEIYYKRSTDGGVSWGADTRLTNAIRESLYSSVSVSGQVVHVVWMDDRLGLTYEIHYMRSTDGGISWESDTRLTNDPANSVWPSVSVSGQVVHVVWQEDRDGNYEIYYKRSTDGGVSWGADIRLTNAPNYSQNPSVSVSGQVVHVVWNDLRDGNSEIYYKRSTDGGISWEADTRLTNDPAYSTGCFVSVSGAVVHVVWTDYRDGNNEIYYKRNPTGNPVGIININSEIPEQFSLSQNYPNPFNPNTVIRYSLIVNCDVSLKVFDVLGNEVTVLVNEQLNAGTYEVDWNASNYPSGIYYYKLTSGDFSQTRKTVLIK